jgi:bis(5'-nucleosyl)-tetraphosphatase (symmetrical)
MSTYVIGDVQGCLRALQRLLDLINFEPSNDVLWFAGDLVNRGEDSAGVLRLIKGMGNAANSVLGNHDIHCLARYYGYAQSKGKDTLDDVLQAEDVDELMVWLQQRPMLQPLIVETKSGQETWHLVHAGLLPNLTIEQAQLLANECEAIFSDERIHQYLPQLYGNKPTSWHNDLQGIERWRMIINGMTRLRYLDTDGEMDYQVTESLQKAPAGLTPWFEVEGRLSAKNKLVFGHWSSLGFKLEPNLIALDTGCVWGGKLTALCLEDKAVFQV